MSAPCLFSPTRAAWREREREASADFHGPKLGNRKPARPIDQRRRRTRPWCENRMLLGRVFRFSGGMARRRWSWAGPVLVTCDVSKQGSESARGSDLVCRACDCSHTWSAAGVATCNFYFLQVALAVDRIRFLYWLLYASSIMHPSISAGTLTRPV